MPFASPGHEINERKSDVVTIQGVSVSNRALIGVTVKGEIGVPTLVTSWPEFVSKFGGFTDNGWVAYAAWAIYKNNPGAKLFVVRTVHYTDINDAATGTAVKSSVMLKDKAATPADTLKVEASSEGTWGDKLKVRITDGATAGTFKLEVLETVGGKDLVRDTFNDLTMDETDAANYVEYKINGRGLKYITVTDQSSASAAPSNAPAAGTFSLGTGNDGLSGITDNDFIGSEASRTGIYALNTRSELIAFAIPGKTTAAVQKAAVEYCATRKDRYIVLDSPMGLSRDEIVDHRETVLAVDTDYAELNWPNVAITDPVTGRRKVVPNSGFILGAMGRTFDNPEKGPWKVAAGIEDGQLAGVIGLETENHEVNDKATRDVIYPAGINPIYFKPGYGIIRYGSKTLAKSAEFLHINQRWTFMYCEKSIEDGTQWEEFENIDTNLMKKAARTINAFLLQTWRAGGLKGDKPADAFYVKVDIENNPESSQREAKLVHDVGLAVHTPNNFSVFNFERDNRALLAQLAAEGL